VPDPPFRRDLYRGAAADYDRFRPPYPRALIEDLARRTGADGTGRLIDLGCGTGQVSFALQDRFAEVWAVDQEPDMTRVTRDKAAVAGLTAIRVLTCPAERLAVPGQQADLVAIGNAFHRMPRAAVAARAYRWLRPGGFLARLWGGSPWDGPAPWQQAMAATMRRWQARLAAGRVPPGYDQARQERPDQVILQQAGFRLSGSYQFPEPREWTPGELAGFVFSTSVLSRVVLGGQAAAFAAELRRELSVAGPLRQDLQFGYDLAARPA